MIENVQQSSLKCRPIQKHRLWTWQIISLLAGVILAGSIQAEMYKWIDDQGRTHYPESPPPKAYQPIEIKGEITEVSIEVIEAEYYQAPERSKHGALPKIRKGDVLLFTTPTCGFCYRAKDYFKFKKIAYRELDIVANEKYRTWFSHWGGRGVPFTIVGGRNGNHQTISGFSEYQFDQIFQ